MLITKIDRNKARQRRHARVRRKVVGTPERPRLNIFRSSKHIYAQLIDDVEGKTLVAASTVDRELRDQIQHGGNIEAAEKVGTLLAERAVANGYKEVVFDRGGYKYHGRVKAVAEAAREGGLQF